VGKQPEIVALSVVAQAMQTPTAPR
jgi:hypothetical protein